MLDKLASLTPLVRNIILDAATEPPGSGAYNQIVMQGTYLCRRCGWALFRASTQFSAGCGWPSFDDDLLQRIICSPDPDGVRTEIICGRCAAHLGHVFFGEQLTEKSQRYCVNSLSLDFVEHGEIWDTEEAIVAGGCFWGIEHAMRQLPGVVKAESGYIGGHTIAPHYEQICSGTTGHYEAVRVVYDREQSDYRAVLKHFFEHHDPYQHDGQGLDRGPQYRSAVFYYNEHQKLAAAQLLQILGQHGQAVATTLKPITTFWPAEAYHQAYFTQHPGMAHCHQRVIRFERD